MSANTNDKLVLITVSGSDQPGITSNITSILAEHQATIVDLGQAVIHGLLSLSILFQMNEPNKNDVVLKDILFTTSKMGLKLEHSLIDQQQAASMGRDQDNHYALTLIGDQISAEALHKVSSCLAQTHCNIDRINRLSHGDFGCVQMMISAPSPLDQNSLRRQLLEIARSVKTDIALQPEGLFRRAKRLVVMDMDSTLIQNEVIDEFARELGVFDDVSAITAEAMKGHLDFTESLKKRCAKIKGLTLKQIDKIYAERIKLTPGAKEFIQVLKRLGYTVALISGGFTVVANRFKSELGLDYVFANELQFDADDVCTGLVSEPIVDAEQKAALLEQLAQKVGATLDQVVAIGDGANDLKMLAKAGLGIAFNAKPIVSEQADLSYNQKHLVSILYLIGLTGREIQEAWPSI